MVARGAEIPSFSSSEPVGETQMVLGEAGRHHTPMLPVRSTQRPAHVDWLQSATVLG